MFKNEENQTVECSSSEFSLTISLNRCHKKFIESSRIRNKHWIISPPHSRNPKERSWVQSDHFAAKDSENEKLGTTINERISHEPAPNHSDSHVLSRYRIRRKRFRLEFRQRFSHGERHPGCDDRNAETRDLPGRTTRSGDSGLQGHDRHRNERNAESGRVLGWPKSPGWHGLPEAQNSEPADASSWLFPISLGLQGSGVLRAVQVTVRASSEPCRSFDAGSHDVRSRKS